jgi:hypothetical protein
VAALGALPPTKLGRQALEVLILRLAAHPGALAADIAQLTDRSQVRWWCHAPSVCSKSVISSGFTVSSPEIFQNLTELSALDCLVTRRTGASAR